MVSLTNQARLLAAQEFNKRVLEQKAREGKKIATSAKRVGVLTGRVAKVDPKTKRVVGVTRTKSATRLQSEKLLRAEIKRQQELRARESDLEKFLRNERRIASGQISKGELERQIAARKRKGLSKTPAQKAALSLFTRAGNLAALRARNVRKTGRGRVGAQVTSATQLQSILRSEEARAGQLGSDPFADPKFGFGGRTREEVIARGGTFGRRVGGESISSQLDFVSSARRGTTTARISFAKSLLSDDLFSGATRGSLLGVVGSQRPAKGARGAKGALTQERFAPPTFEQVLREGVGFFTTKAVPVTKPKITKGERKTLLKARRAEDFAKASEARKEVTRPRQVGRTLDDLQRSLGTELDARNLERAQREFGFGGEQIRVAGAQVIQPTRTGVDPISRLQQARQTQLQTEAFRAGGGLRPSDIAPVFGRDALSGSAGVFGGGVVLTPARGQPSLTQTSFPSFAETEIRSSDFGNVFDVTLREGGIGQPQPRVTPKKKKAKKPKTKARGTREEIDVLGTQVIEEAEPRQISGRTPSPFGLGNIFGEGAIFGRGGAFGEAVRGTGRTTESLLAGGALFEFSDPFAQPDPKTGRRPKQQVTVSEAFGEAGDFFFGF